MAGADYCFYDEILGWQPLGRLIEHAFDDEPYEATVISWPRRYGKTVALKTAVETPYAWAVRGLFAAQHARREQQIQRLADALGWWPETVRRQYDAVQQVLQDAGIGDGYGQLTIPQPVRPPLIPPAGRWRR